MLNVGEEKGRQRAHRDANDYDTLQHPSGEDQQVDGDGGNERDQIWTGKRKRREACHAHEVSTYPGKFRDSPDAGDDEQCSQRKIDRKSTRLNSSHGYISYAVFCLKKKK